MKSFFGKCLLFGALLGLTAALAEWKLRSMPDRYSTKRGHFEAGLHDWQVVVTGSSAEENGIKTGSLSVPAFNLATLAQPLYYDVELVSKYIDRLDRLRMVIVGVSYLTLEYELTNGDNGLEFLYWRDWGIPIQPGVSSGFDMRKYSLLAVYSPQAAVELMLRGFQLDALDNIDANGWDRSLQGREFGNTEELAKKVIASHHEGMRSDVMPANIARLDRLFSLLKGRGIAVGVIRSPVAPAYFDAEIPAKRMAMENALATLCRRHRIPLFDYTRDARIAPADFFNSAHLNVQGAEKFSRIVDSEIIRPNLDIPPAIKPAGQKEASPR